MLAVISSVPSQCWQWWRSCCSGCSGSQVARLPPLLVDKNLPLRGSLSFQAHIKRAHNRSSSSCEVGVSLKRVESLQRHDYAAAASTISWLSDHWQQGSAPFEIDRKEISLCYHERKLQALQFMHSSCILFVAQRRSHRTRNEWMAARKQMTRSFYLNLRQNPPKKRRIYSKESQILQLMVQFRCNCLSPIIVVIRCGSCCSFFYLVVVPINNERKLRFWSSVPVHSRWCP